MTTLEKIIELDKKISVVEKSLKNKDYMGAGIEINYKIGGNGHCLFGIELSCISENEKEFLELMLKSLKNTKRYYVKEAHCELVKLKQYFGYVSEH